MFDTFWCTAFCTPFFVCALHCTLNISSGRVASPLAPPTMAYRDRRAGKTRRSGLHYKIGEWVDGLIWKKKISEELLSSRAAEEGWTYSTPPSELRNDTAKLISETKTADALVDLILSQDGFRYCLWNRKIFGFDQLRRSTFEWLKLDSEAAESQTSTAK